MEKTLVVIGLSKANNGSMIRLGEPAADKREPGKPADIGLVVNITSPVITFFDAYQPGDVVTIKLEK